MEVQDVYYTLVERDPGEHETVYEVAVEILNNHFTPQVNNSFQRNQFRAMEQKPQETIEQFITRLRQKAIYCNFGNVDEAICDQVIDKCSSKRLRRKLLERHNVTLQQLRETAQAMEAAEKQATSIEQPIESVNKVSTYANDTCSEPDYENEDDDYAFTVHGNQGKVSKFTVNVGGIDVPVVIDSGATVNIIDRTLWEHLKKNKIKCESKTSSKNLYAYGSNKPLTIAGSFNTNVCVNDRCVSADFFVIEEDGQALLGHKTSIELGVLKIETNVNTVTDNVVKTNYTSKFPKVFSGSQNIADSLSRLLVVPKNESKQGEINQAEEYIRFVASESTPNAVKIEDVDKMSLNDKELQNIRNCLLNGRWQDLLNKQYLTVKQELSSIGHIVLRGTRLIIPTELRNQILKLGHEGHPGIVLMKQRLRSKVWWPNMDKSIEEYCKSCYGCQLVANPEKPEPMIRTSLPSKPWEQISADFLGPLPSGEYLFTVVDYYSRWLEVTIMSKSTSADRVIDALDKMFTIHGLPISIATDNGPQFISDTFKKYLDQNGIVHRRITPLWPAANGEIERQNRSLLKRMRIANAEKKNLSTEIQTYLKMYRSTPHCTTGVSPAELLFNRTLRTKLPDIQIRSHDDTEVRDRDSQRKEKGKLYADTRRNATTNDLKAGDSVLVKQNRGNKLSTTFNPKPFTLLEKHGNSVVVQNDDGDTYKRNVTHIKRFIERKSSENVNSENVNSENQNVNSGNVNSENQNVYSENQNVYSEIQNQNISSENQNVLKGNQNGGINDKAQSNKLMKSVPSLEPSKPSRPTRDRKLPSRYKDFVLSN
ncbi:unnamed protein product [Mytilus edulis]|uniref:Integrase catalytic domain-containing protein n=1 Tax=Mytilus edulis TaxID=6550 RepID=A0A8S3UTN2_MYTED|nr:unnamed protein product [Mytilus edulis]